MRQQLNGLKTMPNQLKLSPYFLALSLSVSPLIGQSQVVEAQPQTTTQMANDNRPDPTPESVLAKYIFGTKTVSAMRENPEIFLSLLNGRKNEKNAQAEIKRIEELQTNPVWVEAVNTPILDLNAPAKYEWEKKVWEDKEDLLKKMLETPEIVNELAHDLYDMKANGTMPPALSKLYDKVKEIEGTNKLPRSTELDALEIEYGSDYVLETSKLYDTLKSKGLNDNQISDVLTGKIKREELQSLSKMTDKEYKTFVTNNFTINVNIIQPQESDYEAAVKAHHQNVKKFHSYGYALSSALALFDPKTAKTISEANNAATKIYDGVGALKIADSFGKSFDFTAFGNVASGVGIVVSLLKKNSGGASADEVMIGMLKQVLRNQKIIIEQLGELRQDVWYLQKDVQELLRLMEDHHNFVKEHLENIENHLDKIEQEIYESRDVNKIFQQQKELRDLSLEEAKLLETFLYGAHSPYHKEATDALVMSRNVPINGQTTIPNHIKNKFEDLSKFGGKVAKYATVELENKKTNAIHTDYSDIEKLKLNEIKQKLDMSSAVVTDSSKINQYYGMVPKIGTWLGKHLKKGHVQYVDSLPSKPDGHDLEKYKNRAKKNTGIPNPAIFTELMEQYVYLTQFMLVHDHNGDGVIDHDFHIDEFGEDLARIEDAIDGMREHIPFAFAVFNYHLQQLEQQHFDFIYSNAFKQNLIVHDHYLPKKHIYINPHHTDKFKLPQRDVEYDYSERYQNNKVVLYYLDSSKLEWLKEYTSNDIFLKDQSFEEMGRSLGSLNDTQLSLIGEWAGVFEKGFVETYWGDSPHKYKGYPNKKFVPEHLPPEPLQTNEDGEPIQYIYGFEKHYFRTGPGQTYPGVRQNPSYHFTRYKWFYRDQKPNYEKNANGEIKRRGKPSKSSTGQETHYSTQPPDGTPTFRHEPINVLAYRIQEKHGNISKDWADHLRDNEEMLLGELYRSYLTLKVLIEGSYGLGYKYNPELVELSNKMFAVEQVFDLIKNQWMKEKNAFDVYPDIFQLSKALQNSTKDDWNNVFEATKDLPDSIRNFVAKNIFFEKEIETFNTEQEKLEDRKKALFSALNKGQILKIKQKPITIEYTAIPESSKESIPFIKKAYSILRKAAEQPDTKPRPEHMPPPPPGNE
ncbi:hypothetical protein QQ020_23440 [Fulvivirgaceae bacterium BMA12]|uniref:EF-hand domain-containing protein n=1 Tax=Agaribacillus aureus TaxID=3051825 RepID=A0ABT8LBA9_9BACT|nr:hypothetical protein [Fulvivirgaceae bacterium BMA12]